MKKVLHPLKIETPTLEDHTEMLNLRVCLRSSSVFPATILWLLHYIIFLNEWKYIKLYVVNYIKEIGKQGLQVALQCHLNLCSFKMRNFEEDKMRWIVTLLCCFPSREYWNILDLLTFWLSEHEETWPFWWWCKRESVHCLSLSPLFSRIYCLQMLTVCSSKLMSLFF